MKRESALTFLGIVTNAVLAFLTTWIIANNLGASATGDFFLYTSIFTIVASVIGMGADTGLVRMLSGAQAKGRPSVVRPTIRVALGPVIAAGVAVGLAIFAFAEPIAAALGTEHDSTSTVRVLAVALLPGALIGVLLGGSRGLGHILSYTAVQNLFVPFARFAAVAIVAYAAHSAGLVVWAWSLPLVVAAFVAAVLLWRQVGRVDSSDAVVGTDDVHTIRGPFWRFALPRGGSIVIERLLDWADVLVVVALLGAASGGVYGVVTRIVVAGTMLEGALRIVMGPRLSAAAAVGDHGSVETMFQRVTVALILLSWPYYIAVAVYAEDLLGLFGDEFTAGAPALIVLAIAMALRNTMGALQTVLLMTGRSMWQLGNKIVQVGVLFVGALVLVPVLGIVGAAIAYALGVVVDTGLAAVQVSTRLGVRSDVGLILSAAALPVFGVLFTGLILAWLLADAPVFVRLTVMGLTVAAYFGAVGILLRRRSDFFERPAMI